MKPIMSVLLSRSASKCLGLLAGLLVAAGPASAGAETLVPLKSAFKDCFMVGVALNQRQFSEQDSNGADLTKLHFNSISPENVMKWESIHPRSGDDGYNFEAADRFVEFGEKNGMLIVGHTLVWHSQTPRWVFQGEDGKQITREALLERMRDHIHTVVGRYKGRIQAWDVVNEALDEDGTLRQSAWLRIIGDDYIAKAFEYAHEADPDAELRYNDYSIENEPKRKGTIALVKKLQAEKAPISGLGSQTHANLTWPSTELLDATLTEFAELGLPISITELDVDAAQRGQRRQSADVAENAQAAGGGVVSDAEQKLADQYAALFRVFLKHREHIKLVTFWGVTDRDSWRRYGNPLLFDGSWQPKPAFHAVIAEVQKEAATATVPPAATSAAGTPPRAGGPPRFPFGPAPLPTGVKAQRDIAYVENGHPNQVLDLFLPEQTSAKPLPLMIWIHGGAWLAGSHAGSPMLDLVGKGYAVASIQYRFSSHAPWPAQAHDCKAAVRFLRAHAEEYNIDPERFAVGGESAGGHLAAFLGASGDVPELEGDLGNAGVSSRVQAVVDLFGPTDLTLMGQQTIGVSMIQHDAPNSPESLLLGGPVQEMHELAKTANPLTYVDKSDPPFLIMHGSNDRLVPPGQSTILAKALIDAGVEVTMKTIAGADHGGPQFHSPQSRRMVEDFLSRNLSDVP
jgi:endo-1,4-beta-xylanase